MKLIVCPKEITVKLRTKDGEVERPAPFKQFLVDCMDGYDGIKTWMQARQAGKIVDAITTANGNIPLEDADYLILKDAVAAMPSKMLGGVARQIVAYVDSVNNAEDIKP